MKCNTKPKIQTTENMVCATCWIRGQGHTSNTCHCGRGEFVNEGVLNYILELGKEQGKLDFRNEFLDIVERNCMDGDDMLEWVKCGGLRKSIYEKENDWLKSQLSKSSEKEGAK